MGRATPHQYANGNIRLDDATKKRLLRLIDDLRLQVVDAKTTLGIGITPYTSVAHFLLRNRQLAGRLADQDVTRRT